MKKILIPLLVFLLLAVTVTPAFAKEGGGRRRNASFELQGTIAGFDPAGQTIIIAVTQANDYARAFVGGTLVIDISSARISPNVSLMSGIQVKVTGKFLNGVWVARHVTVPRGRNKPHQTQQPE